MLLSSLPERRRNNIRFRGRGLCRQRLQTMHRCPEKPVTAHLCLASAFSCCSFSMLLSTPGPDMSVGFGGSIAGACFTINWMSSRVSIYIWVLVGGHRRNMTALLWWLFSMAGCLLDYLASHRRMSLFACSQFFPCVPAPRIFAPCLSRKTIYANN